MLTRIVDMVLSLLGGLLVTAVAYVTSVVIVFSLFEPDQLTNVLLPWVAVLACSLVGFLVVVRRHRVHWLPLALIYFTCVVIAAPYFGLIVVCSLYGDCP